MFFRLSLFCLFAVTLFTVPLFADWRPISPDDLALKQSRVDPNADAEALFREIHISNEQQGVSHPRNIVTEYVRIKIFTARGKELGNVQLPYYRETVTLPAADYVKVKKFFNDVFGADGQSVVLVRK